MSLKVLLADDSMTAQNMGKKILAESGYDVTTVSNGAAAVKKIAEVKPDLVILDIYMPGYTGLEVCERVRANLDTANLPVLLTVGKMEPYRAEDGAKVRADGVIVKPFEATDLLAVVKKMAEKVVPPTRHVVEEAETQPEEEVGQPEPAMPPSVEVPTEMAAAPAFAMEEFDATPTDFKQTIEWSAAPELTLEHTTGPGIPEIRVPEIPWSFDQAGATAEPQVESTPEPVQSSEVEFTSAPQAGSVEMQQAEGLETGYEAAPTPDIEITTDPALTSAQEMTEFVTSFGETNHAPDATEEVIAESQTSETSVESAWDGWAQVEPEHVAEATGEAAPENAAETMTEGSSQPASPVEMIPQVAEEASPETKPVIDDFEAKVSAAMAGFGVEPLAEQPAEAVAEQPEPAPAEAGTSPKVDDFETRVAAAMSGFGTEPVTPEPMAESQAQPAEVKGGADDFEARVAAAMSGFTAEEPAVEASPQAVEEEPVETTPAPAAAADDFDARLAQALSAFDTAPEVVAEKASAAVIETPVEAHTEPHAVTLNETTVLPQEAMLSLKEEMKEALAKHPSGTTAASEETMVPEPVAEGVAHAEPAVAHLEGHATLEPEVMGEFDPAHVSREEAPQQTPELALAAAAAAATAEHVTPAPAPEKLADAVQRAIERMKPQLIAEIVKELKGE